jgi:uncharacterized protein YbjT (DUF2867 family)
MILVTGATGLSGSAVVREFARKADPVRALVRSRAKAQALETLPTVEVVEGDMLRAETLADALDGVERVLLISSADQQMLETQCAFIDAAKKAGVRHIVKFSGLNSALASPFLFTRMHAEIERYLERSGLAWTHLRPSQFMQVYLREVPTIVAESAFFLPLEDAMSISHRRKESGHCSRQEFPPISLTRSRYREVSVGRGPKQLCIPRRTPLWGFVPPHSPSLRVAMPPLFVGSRATSE